MDNIIKTIESFSEFKLKEKGSVFLAQLFAVENEEDVQQKLEMVRKKYFDATHHCFAFNLLNGIRRYSDDGEPSGTAGIRILNAIQHFKVINILIVVIRYFGGTKLGVGPLGKAYYNSSFELLKNANIVDRKIYNKINIIFDYELTSKIHYLLSRYDVKKITNFYKTKPIITFFIESDKKDDFINKLIDTTANKVEIKEFSEIILM